MRPIILSLAVLAASPVSAQDAPVENPAADDRSPVEPGGNWSLARSDCTIDVGFGDTASLVINPHDDHHDVGYYDTTMKGVVDEKVVAVRYGTGGTIVPGDYHALGHRNKEGTSYVANVDDALLERFGTAGTLQFYRGRTLLADLDVTGIGPALTAMRACEAARQDVASEAAAAAAAADAAAADPPAVDSTEPDQPPAPVDAAG